MDIIKINKIDGIETVNARELWEKLESKQEFANWIKSRLDGFEEGSDFTVDKFINGKATQIDYYLTIDTAKHLAMLERNEIGKKIRQYFIEVEKKSRLILERDSSKLTRRNLTDEIQDSGENERMHGHAFSTYTKLIYKKLGIEYTKRKDFRDTLTSEQLKAIETLEQLAHGYMKLGYEYSQIKQALPDIILNKQKEFECQI